MIDCIREKIEVEVAAREKRRAELKALTDNRKAAQDELATIQQAIAAQTEKGDKAMMRPGGRLAKIDDRLRVLKNRKDTLEDRLNRLQREDHSTGKLEFVGLIPDARRNFDEATRKLTVAVKRALDEPKRAVADVMSQKFAEGMAAFDGYNSACDKLFKELELSLQSGTSELAPLPSCPDLYRLLDHGLLKSPTGSGSYQPEKPVPAGKRETLAEIDKALQAGRDEPAVPQEPIAEPFGVPDESVAAETN